MIVCTTVAAFAVTYSYDRFISGSTTTMNQTGSYYLYSNYPEYVNNSTLLGNNAAYTINQALSSGNTYDVEYYHINTNTNGTTLYAGVAILNTGSTTQNITVTNIASRIRTPGSGAEQCALMQKDYQNSTNIQTIPVPAGGVVRINQLAIPSGYYVGNGKVKIQANGSGLSAKIYLCNSSATDTNVRQCSMCGEASNTATSTGLYAKDSRGANFDVANSTTKSFYLAAANSSIGNDNELAAPISGGRGTTTGIVGNYGIRYDIQLLNLDLAQYNSVKITYDYQSHGSYACDYDQVLLYNGSSWNTIRLDQGTSEYMAIPTTKSFKFLLPGANCGNIHFQLVKR